MSVLYTSEETDFQMNYIHAEELPCWAVRMDDPSVCPCYTRSNRLYILKFIFGVDDVTVKTNEQMNARALISQSPLSSQSAMVYYASKRMEISRVY